MKNYVKELREKNKISQEMLAKSLGVSRQTISAIENGRYDPSLPLAFSISRLFNAPIEEIFEPDIS